MISIDINMKRSIGGQTKRASQGIRQRDFLFPDVCLNKVFLLFNLQASYRPCLLLKITVLRGHNITLGSFDDFRKYILDSSGADPGLLRKLSFRPLVQFRTVSITLDQTNILSNITGLFF